MSDRPDARELAEAVREFLELELLPVLDDPRLRFRTLVALNALGIVERELTAGSPRPEADRELARRIRAGDVPPGTLERVKEAVEARLRIASPRWLERYEGPSSLPPSAAHRTGGRRRRSSA